MGKTTHGLYGHPLYPIWQSMKQRCSNPNHPAYYRYGGRGISVCKQWTQSFVKFIADMGDRPDGMTIERINNNSGYCPSNCIWASKSEQARNRVKRGVHLSADARKKLIAQDRARLAASREARRIAPKACAKCGKMFIHHGGYQEQIHCSMECYAASRRQENADRFIRACEYCKVQFIPKRRKKTARYCSIKCAARDRCHV